jgi:hypothetical protein
MSDPELERWKWTYSELSRIEQHWTSQIQNQEQRIATILATNGFLLGFLGSAAFATGVANGRTGPRVALFLSLIGFSLALVCGLLALRPRTKLSRRSLWLNITGVLEGARSPSELEALQALSKDLNESYCEADYVKTIRRRRDFMQAQLVLLGISLVPLVLSVFEFLMART